MQNNTHINVKIFVFVMYICMMWVAQAWSDTTVDHSIYSDLLEKYVTSGQVDYQGFKTDETILDQYLKVLEKVDLKELSRNERFAFYINAYNAWTIKLILSGYPGVKSIKDLGTILKSPWKKKICRIDGAVITLDDIEHNIIRPLFKDPRVHFAINCAALSCPPLISKPYVASTLDQQLDDSTMAFINNRKSNYLTENTLYVSRIFKWFSEDFNNNIIGFFLKYAKGEFKKELESKRKEIKVKYLHYDWSLNGT
ncbi:MAG: DUF547 domain-containing protein [Desulfobacterales bacterium]|nr:MAG: DUF547 domain-containing protein [Desulfobacterales bacterium]